VRAADALIGIVGRRGGRRVRPVQGEGAVLIGTGAAPAERGVFAGTARLDNRPEIAARLGLAGGAADQLDDSALVAACFERHGEAGLAGLLGAFAFAAWDAAERRLTLVRDYGGQHSLFFHQGGGFIAFASYLADLVAMPGVPRELDALTVANFLALNHHEVERTFYRAVERVPSRRLVEVSRRGVARRAYWSPDLDASPPAATAEDMIEGARAALDRAVARATRDLPHVGVLTSGGFDSSAVAATAARLGTARSVTCYTGVPPDGFSVALPASRYGDERPKVEALGRMNPSLRLRFVAPVEPHANVADPVRMFLRQGTPTRNVSNLSWFSTISSTLVRDGLTVALTGTHGNFTLTWAGEYSLATLLRRGDLPGLLREARAVARMTRRPLHRVVAGEAVLRGLPETWRYRIAKWRGTDAVDVSGYSALRREAVAELDLETLWQAQGFDATYREVGDARVLRAAHIFDRNQLGRDAQAVSMATQGHETRDPFQDRELVQYCLSVPETLYRREGVERWFARKVLADRLPPEILDETRRGAQAPNWFTTLSMRREAVAAEIEALESSPLAQRLLDIPRMKALLAEWPKDDAAAQERVRDYRLALDRGVHVGRFVRWVEGSNG
jgi:asparagine synthase (glutamine-hydrolysing)